MKKLIAAKPCIGEKMHQLMSKIFPICRSITGDGVRETLDYYSQILPLTQHEVPTGTKVFDWEVPREWNIRQAYIEDEAGNRIVDFKNNNLHIISYSVPIDEWFSLSDLQEHLFSLPEQPDAIPYITSYYEEYWGFCLTHEQRLTLKEGRYHVVIDTTLKPGSLTYGECLIKGETDEEVFISSYTCHPSMANNELSGPVVAAYLGKWLASMPRRYSYRIAFVPETIGSITYLSRHLTELKKKCIVGFNLSCLGDEGGYSYLASRYGNTFADRVADNTLTFKHPNFTRYSFLKRGSDESQYCAPGVDLPLVTLSRSKYGSYPEYHTSLDNLEFVTAKGLAGGLDFVKECIKSIEANKTYKINCLCEPQLGKRGLYPNLSTRKSGESVETLIDFLAYADGTNDLIEISRIIEKPVSEILPHIEKLLAAGLIDEISVSKCTLAKLA